MPNKSDIQIELEEILQDYHCGGAGITGHIRQWYVNRILAWHKQQTLKVIGEDEVPDQIENDKQLEDFVIRTSFQRNKLRAEQRLALEQNI